MDLNLDQEFSEFFYEPMAGEIEQAAVKAIEEVETKSSRRLPELWTRVISIDVDDLKNIKSFPMATDLLMAEALLEND